MANQRLVNPMTNQRGLSKSKAHSLKWAPSAGLHSNRVAKPLLTNQWTMSRKANKPSPINT